MRPDDLCDVLRDGLPALFECALGPRGGVRVRSPLLYPDGGIVEAFVVEQNGQYLVTDYGDALGWLRTQSASGKLSPKQRWMVDDIRMTLGVGLDQGQLKVQCDGGAALADAVQRITQAVLRVSDIWFTLRTRTAESIADEVDDWLRERSFAFERGVRRTGKSGRTWTIDYRVVGAARTALVFLLSSGSRAAARQISEHVAAGCFDLRFGAADQSSDTSIVSLFDDTVDVWQPEDINLVQEVSQTVMWTRADDLERMLTSRGLSANAL